MNKKNSKYLLYGGLIILTLWGLSWYLLFKFIDKQDIRGQFGDMFGAVNSLFSGFALCGIAYTIYLQYESNKNSEYQFKFNHLLDTIHHQVVIFNDRINEFNFTLQNFEGKQEIKFTNAIQYYKSIKDDSSRLFEFIKINDGNITEIMSFLYHSNKFLYDYINVENIKLEDKKKLEELYERSLNRHIIEFLSLCIASLEQNKEKVKQEIDRQMQEIAEELISIKAAMLKEILTHNYR